VTASDHDRLRELTAAYVVGALGPDERADLEAHLERCETCRQDVVGFAPLPALLGRVEVGDLAGGPRAVADVDELVAAVRADVARIDRSRRRWRLAAAATTVAAAVAVGAVLVVGADDEPVRRSEGVVLAVEATSGDTIAHVVADERAWGTYVHVSADDLPARDSYAVWTVDRAGAWEPVGSWAPTPDGRAELGCSTALALDEIDRIVITSAERGDQLLVAR
jgi:anti-sigma-K factor RskA